MDGQEGQLTEVLKELGKLAPDQRKTVGRIANEIKVVIAAALDKRQEEIIDDASSFAAKSTCRGRA